MKKKQDEIEPYADYKDRTWKWYESYLLRFWNRPKTILELGSGTGLFLECCAEHNVEALGLEINDSGLAVAKAKGLKCINHNLITPFPFIEDKYYDAVFSCQVLEHIPMEFHQMIINESYRVLKLGGLLQIDTPSCFFRESQLVAGHISLQSPRELKNKALNAGFKHIDMGFNFPMRFEDIPDEIVDELWNKYQPGIFSQSATIMAVK